MNDEVKMKIPTEILSKDLPQVCSSCVTTSQGGKGCNDIHSAFDEEPWRVFLESLGGNRLRTQRHVP